MSIELVVEYLLGFAILFDAVIAWFVLLKNPKGPINQAYFVMIFFLTLWQGFNFYGSYIPSYSSGANTLVHRGAFAIAAFLALSVIYFVNTFIKNKHQATMAVAFAVSGISISVICILTNGITSAVDFLPGVVRRHTELGALFPFYGIFILSSLAFAFYKIIQHFRRSDDDFERIGLKLLALGLAVPSLITAITHLVMPFLDFLTPLRIHDASPLQNVGPASTIFLSGLMAFSILRYRTMNMKVIVRRSAIAIIVTIVFSTIFFLLLKGLFSPNSFTLAEQAIKYFLAFAIVFDASIAWYVLLRNPRGAVNQAYFIMVFWITLWQLASFLAFYLRIPASISVTLYRLAYIPTALLIVSAVYFVGMFVYNRHLPRYALLLLTIGLPFSIISATKLTVKGMDATAHNVIFGPLYPYFASYVVIGMIAIIVTILFHYFHEKNSSIKVQLQYFLLAFLIPIVLGSLTNLFIPLVEYFISSQTHLTSLQSIGPATTTALSGITAYAIIRHRLMDIKVVIRRSTLAVGAYILLSAALLFPLLILRERYFNFLPQNNIIVWVLAIAFLILLFKPLYSLTSYLIKKIIKREKLDFHKWSPEQLWALGKIESPEKFSRYLAERMIKKIPVEHFVFVTYDHPSGSFATVFPPFEKKYFARDEPWLEALFNDAHRLRRDQIPERAQTPQQKRSFEKIFDYFHAEYCLPLKYGKRLLGAIFIGKRIDGEPFTAADEEFLREMHSFAIETQWGVLTLYNVGRDTINLSPRLSPSIKKILKRM